MKRRTFIRTALGLGTAGLLTGVYAWQIEPFWLEFVKLPMPIKNLPEHLVGKTLMQISDLHIGERFPVSHITESLKEAADYAPDFVVYTGDYVSYENAEQIEQLKAAVPSFVKGKLGTFGVLGNHDYGKNWAQAEVANEIIKTLEEEGIKILRNEQQSVAGLNFIGIDDLWGLNFAPQKVLPQVDKSLANICLCHNPDVMDLNVWNDYNSWVLAGHTHGGQVKPPFLPPPMLPVKNKEYNAGRFDFEDGRTLYINRALGHLWQVRFNVRPEITVFTLQKA